MSDGEGGEGADVGPRLAQHGLDGGELTAALSANPTPPAQIEFFVVTNPAVAGNGEFGLTITMFLTGLDGSTSSRCFPGSVRFDHVR